MLLEAEDFAVVYALSAEAALGLAVQQPLSLITLDMLMPDMDDWDFLGHLKQVADLPRIPVLFIAIMADSYRGFTPGAAAVLQKPISRQALCKRTAIASLVPVRRGRIRSRRHAHNRFILICQELLDETVARLNADSTTERIRVIPVS